MDHQKLLLPEDMPAEVISTPVIERIFSFAETSPNAIAIVASTGKRHETRLSYAELGQSIVRFADGLRQLGVVPGDKIAILMNNANGYQALISIFATTLAGAVFVPLNARSVQRELKDAIRRSESRFIVAAQDQLEKLESIRNDLPNLKMIIPVQETPNYPHCFDNMLESGNAEADGWPKLDPEDISEIMFTSGTTAAPKAVVMTHGRTAASAYIYRQFLRLTAKDSVHSFFPIFTTASTKCAGFPILSAGGKFVLDPELNMPDVLERISREKSTIYYGVPAFYVFLLDHLNDQPCKLPDIRLFAYGGAAMPKSAIAGLAKFFPGVETLQTFGATETGGTGTVLLPEYATSKSGSVGRAEPYTEVLLVDDSEKEVPDNTKGHFAVRSPANFKCYLADPENTNAALKDGWVLTGDVGKRSPDGFMYHLDRTKDIIIRGGHNIGSMEIESVLYQHPAIIEAAAVAVPHPKLGEDIFVFVTAKKGLRVTETEILDYCRENLADYRVPRHISFISEMPRNPMGKIIKAELRISARQILKSVTLSE